MIKLLRAKSLRFWVALGMAIALVPVGVSAGIGYVLLHRGVVAPFEDVSHRMREEVLPIQNLRLLLWDTLLPVDEYVEDGNPIHPTAYRTLRTEIESEFAEVIADLADAPAAKALIERARDDWTIADRYATELVAVTGDPRDAERVHAAQRFHGEVAAIDDKLTAAYAQLNAVIEADHDKAILAYERSLWVAGIAGAVSLLTMFGGVFLIGRILAASVDRLVDGAVRFAEGDRDHRIEVQVPPELNRVAEEFNHMIGQIRESERVLDEMAHGDSLTGLPNRRAFDQVFSEIQSRAQRYGDDAALLMFDIDHFKSVNDTYGHAAGDALLKSVAAAMVKNLRPFDKVFRIGGEEFAAVLPKADLKSAREAADRVREAVGATKIEFNGDEIGATISIGLAELSDYGRQDELMKAADEALYRAKTGGRNRVVVAGAAGGSGKQEAA